MIVWRIEPRHRRRATTRHRASRKDRRRLSRHQEGRIHYQTGRGPRCLAVTYAVSGDYVLLRLPEFNDVAHYAPGQPVVLEVPDAHRTVQVRGVAQVAGRRQAGLVEHARFPEPVPVGVATRVICVPLDDVEAVPSAEPDPTDLEASE
jgi:hypothetical protein